MNTQAGPKEAGIAASLPGVLVPPAWLREQLSDPRLRTVDLREADVFDTRHIPGAAHLELSALGSRVGPCDNVLLPPTDFAALMSRLGISNGDLVIAYDDQWGLAASRLLWALHRYGHEAVAVLDGGWDRWVAEGGPVTSSVERRAPGAFIPERRDEVYADRAWVAARSADGKAALLDTRTPAEVARGHIPGATGWDWFNAVPPDSWDATRDAGELLAEWAALGVAPSQEVAVYCRSGMRAAHAYMVLRNAGFERVRLYDGSWQDWSTNMERGRA